MTDIDKCRQFSLVIMAMLVSSACVHETPENIRPNKSVTTYSLKKLNREYTFKIPAQNLKAITSSENGEYVYVIGNEANALRGLDVFRDSWENALGDMKNIPKAQDRALGADIRPFSVDFWAPSHDGLLFTLKEGHGLVVLRGLGIDNASFYEQGHKSFPKHKMMPLWISANNDRYIYLISGDQKNMGGLRFRKYLSPPYVDIKSPGVWNMVNLDEQGLKQPLNFYRGVQDSDGNLLLADNHGIKRIKVENLGKANVSLDNQGQTLASLKDFRLVKKQSNDHISAMAVVDKSFLVMGFTASGSNNGGLVIADITKNPWSFKHFGSNLGLSVINIATERIKHFAKTRIAALITTDQGWLALDNDGNIMEIEEKKPLITYQSINKYRPETKNYDQAHSGFVIDRPLTDPKKNGYLGAAQTKNGLWYLLFKGDKADDNGIYSLEITTDQVEEVRPLELLPLVPPP